MINQLFLNLKFVLCLVFKKLRLCNIGNLTLGQMFHFLLKKGAFEKFKIENKSDTQNKIERINKRTSSLVQDFFLTNG